MDKLKIAFYVGSTLLSLFFLFGMYREQDRINHRLDVRDAYFNKGLIDGAKAREDALIENRRFAERLLNHCRAQKDGCGLPNELTILPGQPTFDRIEALLTRNKE